jgi:hypothetical protein
MSELKCILMSELKCILKGLPMPGFKTDVSVTNIKDNIIEASIYINWFLYNIIVTADINLKYTIEHKAKVINNVTRAVKFKRIKYTDIIPAYKEIFSEEIMMSVRTKIEQLVNTECDFDNAFSTINKT